MKHKYYILLILIVILDISQSFSQDAFDLWLEQTCEVSKIQWDYDYYYFIARTSAGKRFGVDRNYAYKKSDELRKELGKLKADNTNGFSQYTYFHEKKYNFPVFHSKKDCDEYKQTLIKERDNFLEQARSYQIGWNLANPNYNYSDKSKICPNLYAKFAAQDISFKIEQCDCDKIDYNQNANTENTSNLEAEFLAEIAKINADIAVINRFAQNRQIIKSFSKSQQLCDKLRRYQGDQYFSRTLKKIRKENPGFKFSITPLTEQVTREYWIEMRNKANIAYRKATEAYSGLVWNEGIQTYTANVEIPFRFVKATYDLVTNFKSLFDGKLWGSIDAIRNSYGYQDNAVQLFQTASMEVLNAGEDAKDWKSYIGVAGGLLSAFNGYKQTFDLVKENRVQNGLIRTNRETAEQLKNRSKNLLQQFDRYRAYIDSHSSSIDCLRDKIMRIDLDNKTIKGGNTKITIWGTGLYDWTGDEFLDIIKEGEEDLKNEYIYCEDFVKILQITYAQAERDYHTINDKARSSGAVQSQINDVLSQNESNFIWFDEKISGLIEKYTQFCEDGKNNYPDDVIIVSNQVIPGVEEQDGNPNDPPVWEYENEEVYEPYNEPEYQEPEQNNNTTGKASAPGIISVGNGWSAQKIENNPTAIQNDMNSAINSGRTPVGIYISDTHEVLVYYIEGNPLGMTAWKLESYNDATTLQNGITSGIEQGYFPMGISFTNQGNLYVLFIKSEVSVTAWQLVESQLDLDIVSTNMQPWLEQNYVPVGITVYSGMYYTLMTQIPDTKITNWTIEGYQDNSNIIMQNVNAKINSGLLPFGYLKEEGIVNILYVGF